MRSALEGDIVAKVDAESPGSSEVAVQGAGGAFLVSQKQLSVRTISTAKLQLGTAQPVASLLDPDVKYGVPVWVDEQRDETGRRDDLETGARSRRAASRTPSRITISPATSRGSSTSTLHVASAGA